MESLLEILGRLWIIITSFIRRSKTDSSSVLPLSKVSKRSKPFGSRTENEDLVWHLHKEEFLRHPSLRVAKKNRPVAKTKSSKKTHKHNKPTRFAQQPFKAQDFHLSVLSATTQPPPRPPRPRSRPVPDVIITPCTPTGVDGILSINHEFIYTTPFISPLDLTIAALSPKYQPSSPAQHNYEIEISDRGRKPGSDPPMSEDDITNMYNIVLSGFAVSRGRPDVVMAEGPDISDSLNGERFTQDQNFHARSTTPWMSSDSNRGSDSSYVTSTPVKRPILDINRTTSSRPDTPISSMIGPRHSLHLPDEQQDLLPYPDVFDLDMYYGLESLRRSSGSINHSSSFAVRSSSDDKNLFEVQSTRYLSSSPSPSSSPSNFGDTPHRQPIFDFAPETPYREHYRENTSPHSESTSGESLTNYTPTPNPRSMSLSTSGRPSLPLLPLRDTSRAMNILARQPTYPRVIVKKAASQGKAQRRTSIRNNGKAPLPIVVVSHHRFGSFAQDSELDTDASPEVLRARLRQTSDNFSKSLSTENSVSDDIKPFR